MMLEDGNVLGCDAVGEKIGPLVVTVDLRWVYVYTHLRLMISASFELPPRALCSTRVSFESRYGTCAAR